MQRSVTISPAACASTKISASVGSNCRPRAPLDLGAASSDESRSRYGRSEVMASNASATASSRPSSGISIAGATGRVAASVPALVVEEHVRQRRLERRDAGDQPRALDGMRADRRELLRVEATRLLEQPGTDVHLAHIVDGCAEAEHPQPVVRPVEGAAPSPRRDSRRARRGPRARSRRRAWRRSVRRDGARSVRFPPRGEIPSRRFRVCESSFPVRLPPAKAAWLSCPMRSGA